MKSNGSALRPQPKVTCCASTGACSALPSASPADAAPHRDLSESFPYRFTVKDDALAVTVNGSEEIYTFDRAGRLYAAWVGRRFYRRGLDGRLVEKHTTREDGVRIPHRRTLLRSEADAFVDRAAEAAGATQRALSRGEAELLWSSAAPESADDALRLAGSAAAFDAAAAHRDAGRFAAVYHPVGILPPDQYLALVLQVTEGCHWNRCSFCAFYRQETFHAKSMRELEMHLRGVTSYLGDGLSLRRHLFLGEANALCLSTEDLVMRLDLIGRWFTADGRLRRSISSFLDVFTGRRKSVQEFAALRARGLRRVHVGAETGDDPLLRFLNKPQRSDHAADLVRVLKTAGLSVGVIVMAGVGGTVFAGTHVPRTLALLNALPLDGGDLIYISAFVEHPYSDYERAAREAHLRPLPAREIHAQAAELRRGLRFGPGGPRIARYDIEDFIY